MYLTFLGTGSAMPTGDRHQSGLLLEADERALLVDCGSGVLHRLARTEVGYEGASTVLLTHHHLDHVSDLLPLMKARWLAGEEHVEIVGPRGTKELIDGLLSVHEYMQDRLDIAIREVHVGAFEVADFRVEAMETRHSMQCLAYRFESGDAEDDSAPTITVSGDSEAFEGLTAFADGSDVLVHDCSFPDDVDVSNHPTPAQLGEVLAGRDIGTVYLSHLYPHTDGRHREMLDSLGRRYDGDVRFARDLLRIEV